LTLKDDWVRLGARDDGRKLWFPVVCLGSWCPKTRTACGGSGARWTARCAADQRSRGRGHLGQRRFASLARSER
jgi:hypothetical protein